MERRAFLRASALSVGAATGAGALAESARATAASPLRVQVLMFDGVEELDFVAPLDVLGLAGAMSGGAITTSLVTTGRPGAVTCGYGTRVEVQHGWSPREADVLVVPGGGYTDRSGPGVHRVIADRGFLRRLAAADVLPAAICTGTMVLSAAGLTRGRNATTHSGAGGGITSGLDVALWLIERFAGARLAQRVETVLEYERRGTVWRP